MRFALFCLCVSLAACSSDAPPWTSVQDLDTEARHADGSAISWLEQVFDDQRTSGVPLRGAVALVRGNLDGDDRLDILTAYHDSRYLRIAYGMEVPEEKFLLTLAEHDDAEGMFDAAIGEVNGDGWSDVVALGAQGVLYLQNPAQSKPGFRWERVYPAPLAGEWSSIDMVDLNGDGKLEIVALRPLSIGEFPALVQLIPGENPLVGDDWTIHPLANHEYASFAVPGDMDGDGDIDFFGGVSAVGGLVWFRNVSTGSRIAFQTQAASVVGFSGEIHSPVLADLDGDSRLDVAAALAAGLVMTITQGETAGAAWNARTIGDLGPDGVAGLAAADIDGDGDDDLIAGSQGPGPRDADVDGETEQVNVAASAARIAWFQSPGGGTGAWIRHDLVRRERGRFGAFLAADADEDGDIDIFGVRSDSGDLDGLYWLKQLHSPDPVIRFQPARTSSRESRALPLP